MSGIVKQLRYLAVLLAFILLSGHVYAESYGKLLQQGNDRFEQTTAEQEQWLKKEKAADRQRAKEAAARAAERARTRDKSKDFCFTIKNKDAMHACLEEPYSVRNKRARNILLGNCYAFDNSTDFARDLQYICDQGKRGCSLLEDSVASYRCDQCGGTRQWVATYSLGTIIQCWK